MLHLNLCDILTLIISSLNHDTMHAHDEPQVYFHPRVAGGKCFSAPCLLRVKHRLGMACANGIVPIH